MQEVLAKVERGGILEAKKLTVAQFLTEDWLPSMRMSIEHTTWDGYREKINSYVLQRIGEIPLGDLKPPKLNAMYADIRENGRIRGDAPLSLKTVREVHVILHRALEDAVRWGYIETNPASRANPPSATAARNQRKKAISTWTAEEVHRFAALHREHPFYALWLLAPSAEIGTPWPSLGRASTSLVSQRVVYGAGCS
jgi:hypothetical protein